MSSRSASPTIKGYVYQFDESIFKILNSKKDEVILIEDVEDIDIESSSGREAIQCKYLPSMVYSLASIRDAILPMLVNMLERKRKGLKLFKFRLYAYFSDKSPQIFSLNLQELKNCIVLHKRDGTVINYQVDLKATDTDLDEFLNHLRIEFAEDYDAHKNKVFDLIRTTYSCTNSAEIELYYNNALTTISLAAADSVLKNRKLTKKQFLTKTKTKEVLYSVWRLQDLGKKKYCKELRKIHFTVTNIPPYARLFIIELNGTETKASIKDVLLEIRRKWSSHTIKRKLPQERYAPYILLLEIKPDLLAAIKSDFFDERICFTDGFPFREALFNTEALNKEQTDENQISLRFINEPALIHSTFSSLTKRTKEVYQFYITKPFGIVEDIKNIQIKIEDISYIREII
ncbi:MAG TPA: hypothetical protein DDW84_04500 [Phycisphaerales bacterium]|nr:hypothetical protein [Phycisphaerales bacterium]HBR20909.1 hypothetical protein [Phycisphaerales bacterium]